MTQTVNGSVRASVSQPGGVTTTASVPEPGGVTTCSAVADPKDFTTPADKPGSAPGTPDAGAGGGTSTGATEHATRRPAPNATPVLEARGLVKTWGHVIGLAGVDLRLDAGEVLGIIGDNGAGKSTLIKCLSGALQPDRGEILLEGQPVSFKSPLDSQHAGIETVYQTLAVSPALDIASNMFLGREERVPGPLGLLFRKLDNRGMRKRAKEQMSKLGITTLQDMGQTVETLSGGQRQAVAVARAAAFGSKVIILDEPTAALGVRESNQVLDLIRELRKHGLPVILISHNMPHVFDVADRVHIQRLGRCAGVVSPATTTPEEAVAIMTGAKQLPAPAA
jgi:fructose transport system ATP-binding protein